jgi:protein tyrosine/serine phosphatase
MPGDGWKEEAAEALANGILYTNIPMSGFGTPKNDEVRRVLALFEAASTPVFIHCQHGCDRTGTIVACYRIQHDGWPSALALREAERYGISKFEYLMKRYVVEFGRALKPDLRVADSN